ncbi:hypothetical protein P4479_08755 [Brevibacillus agri]|uniref:hypothetical protein n=2 Tax=Brevibacillus TaxID=55080 RepID=UPI0002A4F493|nr:hypothetical protein [Brevibacillus agri]ELK41708.1 hypothetical protein D478_12421 [Brevibacillus agri BAB-2500]MED3498544.1 hypothetical protein [Brevibacillus agri]
MREKTGKDSKMTHTAKLLLLGSLTGLLVLVASPVLQHVETFVGLWMVLWSRISLRKRSVYGMWKLLACLALAIGSALMLWGILLTSLDFYWLGNAPFSLLS